MKVKELIELLLEYPMDAEVSVGCWNLETFSVERREIQDCDKTLGGEVILIYE